MPVKHPLTGELVLNKRNNKPCYETRASGMTFHDMRHTAVSLWISTGANDMQVAAWAGHRSVAFTKTRYGHLFNHHADAVVARLDALIAETSRRSSASVTTLRPGAS